MAAADRITIEVTGRGGHAAEPHNTADTIVIGAQIVSALQTIAADAYWEIDDQYRFATLELPRRGAQAARARQGPGHRRRAGQGRGR